MCEFSTFLCFHVVNIVHGESGFNFQVIEMSGVCAASDIWSVGCTVIELLTCVPPYYDLQPMPALFRIVQVCSSFTFIFFCFLFFGFQFIAQYRILVTYTPV